MASWQGKMCPLLSLGVMARPVAAVRVVGAPAAEPELLGCQGPNCMFFTPMPGAEGNAVEGACSPALVPHAVSQLVAVIQKATTVTKGN